MSAQSKATGGAIGSAFVALAILIASPLIERWEGTRTEPYRDVVGIWTVCTGETRVAMRRYTAAECEAMLDGTLSAEFAPAVLAAVPALRERPHQFAAAISLTYNIGPAAFARSTVARRFNAGDWKGGCDAFLMWVNAGGQRVQGLVNRREAERKLCLTNL
ncbi:lysozyme [Sphingobium sp. SYK-6]|uniref:lysozyme n=1 Tax=Sphingobium sp. (strain NBRC 103272 / SYK-6) TaxID=627192 RepID=UPI000227691B|nr:lysozyme [Sphingobium sp. SYK-6]BAK65347.1 lysozyme [Sphingobium sp. SYK-6]